VIALGVPTVVDAATIVNDVMDNLIILLEENFQAKGLSKTIGEFSPHEKRQLVKELMNQNTRNLYVTPKDIDENIAILAGIISGGINKLLTSNTEDVIM
jgi:spore protease